MVMLACLLTRRRIGAYLDGALENGPARSIARHLSRCSRCQGEAENIRRVRALLQRTLSLGQDRAEPDWSGFWPGIVRGIEEVKHREIPAPVVSRGSWWWRPRLTLGGALVAAALVSVTLWQLNSGPPAPVSPVGPSFECKGGVFWRRSTTTAVCLGCLTLRLASWAVRSGRDELAPG